MNCEQIDELLGAYALGAVDDEERSAIEAHLSVCDRHGEATQLRAVTLGLGRLAPERDPSDTLEARIISSIVAPPPSVASPVVPRTGIPWRWPAAIAAAIVIGVLGLAGGVLIAGGGHSPVLVHVYSDGDASMRIEGARDSSSVQVAMSGLERRTGDQAYQLWAVRDGRWVSVGICNTNEDAWWHGNFDFAAQASDEFVLTIEPAGGSSRPTGTPILGSPNAGTPGAPN